ncbi:MAG: DUF892 family protein [Sphingomonadaceae bacterium]|nr:DUF892 family protein [Sphingomonadaceae bacterium]
MAKAKDLKDYYVNLLADTLSANEQMLERVEQLEKIATNAKLRDMLGKTQQRMPQHNDKLREILYRHEGKVAKEHCKGMEGIAAEAKEHAIKLKTDDDNVRDAAIIHAMQQMSHYGIAGYGTAAAFADAIGEAEDARMLRRDLKEIFGADDYLTPIAESGVNEAAAEAVGA